MQLHAKLITLAISFLCLLGSPHTYAQIQVDSVGIDRSCFNGNYQVTLLASGGTAPLLYSKNAGTSFQAIPVFNNLAPGVYPFRVKDALGLFTDTLLTLDTLQLLVIDSVQKQNPACGLLSGTISAFASGEGPLSYKLNASAWQASNLFQNLAPGSHLLSVKDSMGCVSSQTVTLNGAAAPSLSASLIQNPTCSGDDGQIHLQVFGSSVSFDFAVDTGQTNVIFHTDSVFTGLGAGIYTFYVRDENGCLDSLILVLIESNDIAINSIQSTAPSCQNLNGSILIFATGGQAPIRYSIDSGATYQASPFFSNLGPGTYGISVKDASGCTNAQNFQLNPTFGVSIDQLIKNDAICNLNNGSIQILASSGTAPYAYSVDGGNNYFSSPLFNNLPDGVYPVSVQDANGCISRDTVQIQQSGAPSFISIQANNQSCDGVLGSILINASGAGITYSIDAGLSYSNNPNFTNLTAASYAVWIKDSLGCTADTNITLQNLNLAKINGISSSDEKCSKQDGTITVHANNPVQALIYSIDGGNTYQSDSVFTGLIAGSYNIQTLDPSGCTDAQVFQVQHHNAPQLDSLILSSAFCNNNNGSATAYSSNNNLIYSWNGNAFGNNSSKTNLAAGPHYLIIQDSLGCTDSISFNISQVQALTISSIAQTQITCNSTTGSFEVNLSGGSPPFQYSIDSGQTFQNSPIFSNLVAAVYQITILDSLNCRIDSSFSFEAIPLPSFDSISVQASSCSTNNGSFQVFHTNHISTNYSLDGGSFQNTTSFNNLAQGLHSFSLRDSMGCQFDTSIFIPAVNPPSLDSLSFDTASCGLSNGGIQIYASGGGGGFEYSLGGAYQASNVFSNLSPGVYNLSIRDDSSCIETFNFSLPTYAPLLALLDSSISPTCNLSNGLIYPNTQGGSGSVQYSLDGSAYLTSSMFSGLAPGVHELIAMDYSGCTDTLNFTLNALDPTGLASADAIPTSCDTSNGSFNLIGSGGNPPYQYSIDNGVTFFNSGLFTGLSAGPFNISILDAQNCRFDSLIILDALPLPSFDSFLLSPEHCNQSDGSVQLFTTGAGLRFSINNFTWTSTTLFVGLNQGRVKFSIIDTLGCRVDTFVDVPYISGVDIDSLRIVQVDCDQQGGEITINASEGVRPYLYSFDGGWTFTTDSTEVGLSPGPYDLIVQGANGCENSLSVTLSDALVPVLDSLIIEPINCRKSFGSLTAMVTGGIPPFLYSLDSGMAQTSNTFDSLSYGWHLLSVSDSSLCEDTISFFIDSVSPLKWGAINVQDAFCGNGNGFISVNAAGGMGMYAFSIDSGATFTFNQSFSNLQPGTYNLQARDSLNCLIDTQLVIQDYNAPVWIQLDTTHENCLQSDGAVLAQASGFGILTYTLNGVSNTSGSFIGLSQGNYTLSITDTNNCSIDSSFYLYTSNGPQLDSVDLTGATCGNSNGEAMLYHSGGQPPFSYEVNGGVAINALPLIGLDPGWNQITIKDASQCDWRDSVFIPTVNSVQIGFNQINQASCGQSNALLDLAGSAGVPPYQFAMSNLAWQTNSVFNNLAAGTYWVKVKDANNCVDSTSVNIIMLAMPGFSSIQLQHSTCDTGTGSINLTGSGGIPPYSYSFNGGQTSSSVSGLSNLSADTFNIRITDDAGCFMDTSLIVLQLNGPSLIGFTTQDEHCMVADGSITVNAIGNGPLSFSIDSINWDTSRTITGLSTGTYNLYIKDTNSCLIDTNFSLGNIPGVSFKNLLLTHANCNQINGWITTTLNNANGTEEYSTDLVNWQSSPIFSSLGVGHYMVYLRDAWGCMDSAQFGIKQLGAPSLLGLDSVYNCSNQTYDVTVSVSGGTKPYSFSSNGGFTYQTDSVILGVQSGQKTFMVRDANGCLDSITTNLVNYQAFALDSLLIDQPACGKIDGSISAFASGIAPVQYSIDGINWQASGSFKNLGPGVVQLQITDSLGCLITQQISLINIAAPGILINSVQNPTCGYTNGSLDLSASGAGPFLFALDTAGAPSPSYGTDSTFSNLPAGNYTIFIKDTNRCESSQTFTLFEVNNMQINSISGTSPDCSINNGSITFTATGGTPPLVYSVDSGLTFSNNGNFQNLGPGQFYLTVKDAKGCDITQPYYLSEPQIPSLDALEAYPQNCGQVNGSILLFISGGVQPYEVSIDGGNTFSNQIYFTGLSKGLYPVVIKDQKNCFQYDTAIVDSVAVPEWQTLQIDSANCEGFGGGITINASGAGLIYSITNWGQTNSTGNFANVPEGTYTLSLSDSLGCTLDTQIYVPTRDLARIIKIETEPETCGNQAGSIVISVSGDKSQITYSINNGLTFQADSVYQNLSAGNYTVIVKHPNTCDDTLEVEVPEITGPQVSHIVKQPAHCGQSNGSASMVYSGGTGMVEISWNGGPFGNITSFSSAAAGNYYVVLRDSLGCRDSVPFDILGIDPPSLDSLISSNPTCGNNNGSLTLQAANGLAPYKYSINGGASYYSNPNFTGLAAGTYTLQIEDALHCQWQGTASLNQLLPPLIDSLQVSSASCGQNNGTISVYSTGNGDLSYSINGLNWTSNPAFDSLSPGVYNLALLDTNNCITDTTISIAAIPLMSLDSIHIVPKTCGLNNGGFTLFMSGGQAALIYSLNGFASGQSSNVFTNLNAGMHYIAIGDANGCQYIDSVFVPEILPMQLSFEQLVNATCDADNGFADVQVVNGLMPYQFSLNSVQWQSSKLLDSLSVGNHMIYVKDASGCMDSINANIDSIMSLQVLSIYAQDASCGLSNGALVSYAAFGRPPYSYSLDGLNYQVDSVFNALPIGNYVLYTKDASGCLVIDSVTVNGTLAPLVLVDQITSATCENPNGAVLLNAMGQAPFSYAINGGGFTANNHFTNLLPGWHVVGLLDGNHCTVFDSVFVPTDLRFTSAVDIFPAIEVCEGMEVELRLTSTLSLDTCKWTMGDGTVIYNCNPFTYTYQNPACYDVQLEVSSSNGCVLDSILSNQICVNSLPINSFYADLGDEVKNGAPINITNYSSASDSMAWHMNGVYYSSAFEPDMTALAGPTDSMFEICLETFNDLACGDVSCVSVKVDGSFKWYMPSSFTPNGDGLNEEIAPVFEYPPTKGYLFQVFDRWGGLMFSSNDPTETWKGGIGESQTDNIKSGGYIYKIEFINPASGFKVKSTGSIVLIP